MKFSQKCLAVILCLSILFTSVVPAFAEEVIPYNEDEVVDFEFLGYYDDEQGRIVMYEELATTYAVPAVAYYAVVGIATVLTNGFLILNKNDNFKAANYNFWNNIVTGLSDSAQEFFGEVGTLFVNGNPVSKAAMITGKAFIREAISAVVAKIKANNEDYELSPGSFSLTETVLSENAVLDVATSDSDFSDIFYHPWKYAVVEGAKFHSYCSSVVQSSNYLFYGLGKDDYGYYVYFEPTKGMLGYDFTNITPSSIVENHKPNTSHFDYAQFYLNSQSAYDAAIATGSSKAFLTNDSFVFCPFFNDVYDITNRHGTWIANTGSYSASGALSTLDYQYLFDGKVSDTTEYKTWLAESADVTLSGQWTTTDVDSVISDEDDGVPFIPGGLSYDITSDAFDRDAFINDLADTIADRIAGIEQDKEEEKETNRLLDKILGVLTGLGTLALPVPVQTVVDNVWTPALNLLGGFGNLFPAGFFGNIPDFFDAINGPDIYEFWRHEEDINAIFG